MKMVKIKIKDKRKYANVAYLVDNPKFLERVREFRTLWRLEVSVSYDDFEEWVDSNCCAVRLTDSAYKRKQDVVDKVADRGLPPWARDDNFEEDVMLNQFFANYYTPFWFCVLDLRENLQRPPFFDNILAHVVVCNEVRDADYSQINGERYSKDSLVRNYLDTVRNAIFLNNPRMSTNQLKKELDEANIDFLNSSGRRGPTEVKRDRVWYWKHQRGLSCKELGEQAQPPVARKTVYKAIKDYEHEIMSTVA